MIDDIQRASEQRLRKLHINDMMNMEHDKKVNRSNATVKEFADVLGLDTVYVSTSGGKDSAVLSKLCTNLYPGIKHIMFDTGLEYKASIELAKSQGAEVIPPKTSWVKSCNKHGYPVVSKNVSRRLHDIGRTPIGTLNALFNKVYGLSNKWLHLTSKEFIDFPVSGYCCTEFKKNPSKRTKLNPIIATRIEESNARKSAWKKSGCNSYSSDGKHGVSRPLSLWKDKDIDLYVRDEKVALSVLYTQYEQKRTGCKICPYGAQLDGSRFDLLKQLEPKAYDYFINKTKLGYILMISGVDIISDIDYMFRKNIVEQDIEHWRSQNNKNNYLDYRCQRALEEFSYDQLVDAINHLISVGTKFMYSADDIKAKLKELNQIGGRKEK